MASSSDKLDWILKNSGASVHQQSMIDTFRGLNIRNRNSGIQVNRERHGWVFFTRPRLNLSTENILGNRVLEPLLSKDPYSIPMAVRNYLDDRVHKEENAASKIVDPRNPFIALLSNNCISHSGWRDYQNQTTSSAPGVYRETTSWVDDTPKDLEEWDLSLSFRNIDKDPISFILYIWLYYSAAVSVGDVDPYPDMVVDNEYDYHTRVYEFLVDIDGISITRAAACGYGYWTAVNSGNIFNYSGDAAESPFPTAGDQVTANLHCHGTIMYDPIILDEFNWLVEEWHRNMRVDVRDTMMQKLEPVEFNYFSNVSYPYIDIENMKMCWYVDKDLYEALKSQVVRPELATSYPTYITTGNEGLYS